MIDKATMLAVFREAIADNGFGEGPRDDAAAVVRIWSGMPEGRDRRALARYILTVYAAAMPSAAEAVAENQATIAVHVSRGRAPGVEA